MFNFNMDIAWVNSYSSSEYFIYCFIHSCSSNHYWFCTMTRGEKKKNQSHSTQLGWCVIPVYLLEYWSVWVTHQQLRQRAVLKFFFHSGYVQFDVLIHSSVSLEQFFFSAVAVCMLSLFKTTFSFITNNWVLTLCSSVHFLKNTLTFSWLPS